MVSSIGLEGLSVELLDGIVSRVPLRDRSSLSRVSRALRDSTYPRLYSFWEYRGDTHSFKSLHYFVRAVIQNRDLASFVKSLDLREWGDTPRLDDEMGSEEDNGEEPEDDAEEYAEFNPIESEEIDSVDDSDNGKAAPSEDTKDAADVVGGNHLVELSDNKYDEDFPIFHQALLDLGLNEDLTNDYGQSIRDRSEDNLLALLLTKLPNLQTLHIVIPEDDFAISMLISEEISNNMPILGSLHTIYLCSALHIGIKGHREYQLDSEHIHPFFQLKNLKSLKLLTPFETGYPHNTMQYPKLEKLAATSGIEQLVIEEPENNPHEMMKLVLAPKALKSLRIQQEISCFSIGSCFHPLSKFYGETINAHKDSLEELDLDILHRPCGEAGHANNPDAVVGDMMVMYKENREQWKNTHLIGSLKDFTALRKLSISPSSLCGDRRWGFSRHKITDILPSSLEALELRIDNAPGAVGLEFAERWVRQLLELVKEAAEHHPNLKSLTLRRFLGDWVSFPVSNTLREACVLARINLHLTVVAGGQHHDPYFEEILGGRNPGRDY